MYWLKSFRKRHNNFSTDLEPVDGTAVDEGRELSESVTERVTDGREGDDDVEVLTAAIHEEGKQRQGTEVCVLVSSGSSRTNSLETVTAYMWARLLQKLSVRVINVEKMYKDFVYLL